MEYIQALVKNAEIAMSELYDGLVETVPEFSSISMGFITVDGYGKMFSSAIHAQNDCVLPNNPDDLLKTVGQFRRTNEILFRDFSGILEDK